MALFSLSGGAAGAGGGGGSGTIDGTVGATDNRIPRSDGVGGSTLQAGLTTEDDSGNLTTAGHFTPGKRVKGKQGADVASDANITLGDGNYFQVTGTTAVDTISSTGWPSGSVIVLQFTDSLTVRHGASGDFDPLALAGSANLSATAGDTLSLIYDAVNGFWREISRTAI